MATLAQIRPRVLAVGGGKGGVGKSMVTAMLGICLASLGKRTVLIDADLNGADLHRYLAMPDPDATLLDYIERRINDLDQLLQRSRFPNLRFIPGVPGPLMSPTIKHWCKIKLLRQVHSIQADYVLFDLSAGQSNHTLDFFLCADDGIVVTTCDPLALCNAFGFIRAALMRKLSRTFSYAPEVTRCLLEAADLSCGEAVQSIHKTMEQMPDLPDNWRLLIDRQLSTFRAKVILNQIAGEDTIQGAGALQIAVNELMHTRMENWGGIHYDRCVQGAAKNLEPSTLMSPGGPASEDIVRIVHRHILARELNAVRASEARVEIPARICNYRCLIWNCCSSRIGGLPCAKTAPVSLAQPG